MFTIGDVLVGFTQSSQAVTEGVDTSADVCAEITLPAGKELGCDIDVTFTESSGALASKYNIAQ